MNLKSALIATAFFASNSYAFNFDKACAEFKAVKTNSTGTVCRLSTDDYNLSIHRNEDGYSFAQIFIYHGKLNDNIFNQMKKLAAVMEVEISKDFIKAIPQIKPNDRLGMMHNDKYIFWRTASPTSQIDYSGFAIYPVKEPKISNHIQCNAAGCGHDSETTWLGPVVEVK